MTEQLLWYSSFLTNFSPRVQEKLLSLAETFNYQAGQDIFHEGDPSLYLYVLKAGHVAIEVHVPSKGRRTIFTSGPGDVFGWSALVEPRIETAAARAVEEAEVLGIKGGVLMDLCREDRELGFELYRALAEVIMARMIATRLQLLDVFAVG
jgi:CRP/FNR family cyclic AMP-dependent transcriptional regulator